MRGLLYLALGVAIVILVATSFLVWVNYMQKKRELEDQYALKQSQQDQYINNMERDLLRKELD
jgi:cytoskeletal protein RodZ